VRSVPEWSHARILIAQTAVTNPQQSGLVRKLVETLDGKSIVDYLHLERMDVNFLSILVVLPSSAGYFPRWPSQEYKGLISTILSARRKVVHNRHVYTQGLRPLALCELPRSLETTIKRCKVYYCLLYNNRFLWYLYSLCSSVLKY
jgi:hypothetical protein